MYSESLASSRGPAEYLPSLHGQLRRIAGQRLRRERLNHTLQPTALVNEAYLKLGRFQALDIKGNTHFIALASSAMRQVLIDYARHRNSLKRGGGVQAVTLSDALRDAGANVEEDFDLQRALEKLRGYDPIEARVVELRYFVGLTEVEIACELGCSDRWVRMLWTHAKAWLRKELAA